MRLMWGAALGGAGIVFQNNTSWGFDQRSALAAKGEDRDKVLDLEGHLARFFNASEIDFAAMEPNGKLSSSGLCLANPGVEYVVYAQKSKANFTVDLSPTRGKPLRMRWYNPRTGEWKAAADSSGNGEVSFTPPFDGDAVLHLKRMDKE